MATTKNDKAKEIRAIQRFSRISAFKARKIADLIRGKRVEDALNTLKFMPQKASEILEKLVKSAVANAEQKQSAAAVEDLWVKKVTIDEGPTMHRIQFRAQGRVYRIRKRTSHITLILEEKLGDDLKPGQNISTTGR
ncbi:50S ribosomal protein L22 [bacterium]|nr:50S ribosomal protein L22 [candidate division CSSED10-310 bacterium]